MKTHFIFLLVFLTNMIFSQDTIPIPSLEFMETHSQIFSLSPISKKVDKVNGLVFGVGHYQNKHIEKQTINGVNVDLNPVGLALPFFLLYLPEMIQKGTLFPNKSTDTIVQIEDMNPKIQVNGLNISTGCFFTNASLNGFNISLFNSFNQMKGFSIAPMGIKAVEMMGLSVGIYNGFNDCHGLSIGLSNETVHLKGVQIGIYNTAQVSKGVQIGIFNISRKKGFQLGIWNMNHKRSMPFINW